MAITNQEAWTARGAGKVRVPDFIAEVIERVAFERGPTSASTSARGFRSVCRSPFSRTLCRTRKRRAIQTGERDIVHGSPTSTPRCGDHRQDRAGYEGELVGGHVIRVTCSAPRRRTHVISSVLMPPRGPDTSHRARRSARRDDVSADQLTFVFQLDLAGDRRQRGVDVGDPWNDVTLTGLNRRRSAFDTTFSRTEIGIRCETPSACRCACRSAPRATARLPRR